MTDQTPITVPDGSRTDILLEQVALYRLQPELLLFDAIQSLFARPDTMPRESVQWILDRALAQLETSGPSAAFDDLRSDAGFWADVASPREIEIYFVACLRVLMRDRGRLNTGSLKRLMVEIWGALPAADRAAFLSKVDPAGEFRRA